MSRKDGVVIGGAAIAFSVATLISHTLNAYEAFHEGRGIVLLLVILFVAIVMLYYYSQYMSQHNGYYYRRDLQTGFFAALVPTLLVVIIMAIPIVYGAWVANSGGDYDGMGI
jgi:uncharacterized membrane-anchored protein